MPRWSLELLNLTIRRGSVYYFADRSLTSPEPHYFIVLSPLPDTAESLVFAVVSSKVESTKKWRKNCPIETVVEIKQGQHEDFPLDSVVDCNSPKVKTKTDLLEKLRTGMAKEKGRLAEPIVEKIRKGVLCSKLVERSVQEIIE